MTVISIVLSRRKGTKFVIRFAWFFMLITNRTEKRTSFTVAINYETAWFALKKNIKFFFHYTRSILVNVRFRSTNYRRVGDGYTFRLFWSRVFAQYESDLAVRNTPSELHGSQAIVPWSVLGKILARTLLSCSWQRGRKGKTPQIIVLQAWRTANFERLHLPYYIDECPL